MTINYTKHSFNLWHIKDCDIKLPQIEVQLMDMELPLQRSVTDLEKYFASLQSYSLTLYSLTYLSKLYSYFETFIIQV